MLQVIAPGQGAGAQLQGFGLQQAQSPVAQQIQAPGVLGQRLPQGQLPRAQAKGPVANAQDADRYLSDRLGLPSLPHVNTALGPTLQYQDVTAGERQKLSQALDMYIAQQEKMRDNEDLVSALTDLQKQTCDFQTEWKLSHFGVDARGAGSVFSQHVDGIAKDMLEKRFKGRPELAATFRDRAAQISLSGFQSGSAYDSQQDLQYRKQQLDGQMANLQGIIASGTPEDIDAAAQLYRDSLEVLFPGMDHTKDMRDLDKSVYMGMIQRKVTDGDPEGAMAYLYAGRANKVFGPGEIEQAKRSIEGQIKEQGRLLLDAGDIDGLRALKSKYGYMMGTPPTASNGNRPYSDLALNEANNNPGNISGKGGVGNGYAAFNTTLEGFQALDRLIQTKYKNMTPLQLANKYAPKNDPRGENNPDAYAKQIANSLGIKVDDVMDVTDPMVRNKLMKAIAKVEGPTNRMNLAEIDYVTGVTPMPEGYKSKDLRKESKYPNGITPSEDLNANVAGMAAQFNGKVKYEMGAKNPAAGKIDCSGWVTYLLRKSGVKGIGGHAENVVTQAWEKGTQVSTAELFANPKEGLVIGLDQGPKEHDRGRTLGIDHVAMTYRDPKTGEIMVTESAGSGVHNTPLREWLAEHQSKGHKFFTADVSGDRYNAARGGRFGLSQETQTALDTMIETAEGTKIAQDLGKGVMDGSIKQSEAIARINAITNPKVQAKARAQFGHEMNMKNYMDKELVAQATEKASQFVVGVRDKFDQDPAAATQELWEEWQRAEAAAEIGGKADKEYAKLLGQVYKGLGNGLAAKTNPTEYNNLTDKIARGDITSENQLHKEQSWVLMQPKDQKALETYLKKAQTIDTAKLKQIFGEIFGAPNPMDKKSKRQERDALYKMVQQDVVMAAKDQNQGQNEEWLRAQVKKYATPYVKPGLWDTNKTFGQFAIKDKDRDVFPEMTKEEKAGVAQVFAQNPKLADQFLSEARTWKDQNSSLEDESTVAELMFWRSQKEAQLRVKPPAKPEKLQSKNTTWEFSPIYHCWGWTWMDGKVEKFEPYIYKVER